MHISDDGVPIMLQLLQDATEQQLAVFALLSETSVVGQCEGEKTSPGSVAVTGNPLPAEPQASCKASSSTRTSDAPIVSAEVSMPFNADQPETASSVRPRH